MNRKDFLKTCGFACLGGSAMVILMQSCTVTKTITGNIENSDLMVAISDFESVSDNKITFKKHVIINNDVLKFPICVYRIEENKYNALWLECTHQGNEVQVFGDKLQCPAHGSEFSNSGLVTNGPADRNLRTFPVTIEGNYLKISLKAV
ncbi:MAG: Rieske (2Fe-2S) protein [Saprospiraceae bacterium]|nr:Rieske (2Fe-2S) protein [Saprospiraceae bacterium]